VGQARAGRDAHLGGHDNGKPDTPCDLAAIAERAGGANRDLGRSAGPPAIRPRVHRPTLCVRRVHEREMSSGAATRLVMTSIGLRAKRCFGHPALARATTSIGDGFDTTMYRSFTQMSRLDAGSFIAPATAGTTIIHRTKIRTRRVPWWRRSQPGERRSPAATAFA